MSCSGTESWLEVEVLTGLQKLLCLGLEGAPADDSLDGTSAAWIEAMTHRRHFDYEDRWRIRDAFSELLRQVTRWPTPAQLMQCMQSSPEPERSGNGGVRYVLHDYHAPEPERRKQPVSPAARECFDKLERLIHRMTPSYKREDAA